jgi:hypothetical protein
MLPFLATLGYLALHLLAYKRVLLPRWPVLRSERGIFAYHAGSYLVANLAVAIAVAARPELHCEWLVFTLGAHGIYSLSFLELWSLTQGSYSLSVLAEVDRLGAAATSSRLQELAEIGRGKKTARASALSGLGLMHPDGRSLTLAGTLAAWVFRLLLFVTNGQPLNR